jgi:hypothetical protein
MATASGSTDEAMHQGEPYVTHPMEHVPRLVLSTHVLGQGVLGRVASFVNRLIGSMYLFVAITFGIVVWLFAGNIVGFDKTPWPLLLTILNLPQLSIMISLQVSANRALAASDARAIADHETLHAIHELAKMQIRILDAQNKVLDGQNLILELLKKAHPMPTGQAG